MEEKIYEQVHLAVQHFKKLEDPGIERSKQYPLIELIVIALSAVLSEAESFYDLAAFGKTKQAWLRQFLELENGIASHDTFNRVFTLLDPTQFQVCVLDWVRSGIGGSLKAEEGLAIDGKQLRGSGKSEINSTTSVT